MRIMQHRHFTYPLLFIVLFSSFALLFVIHSPVEAVPAWTSPNQYRVLLTVDPRVAMRRKSPAAVDIYFQDILASKGTSGVFDENTIEVIAYDFSGQPKVFDSTRTGYEQYLLPWRVQKFFGINKVTLSFVIPDQTYTSYAIYFDTKESGLGKPTRYPGIVGDGDLFTEGFKRREINASLMDDFADFDGDGDLDLFKAGIEPYILCYENVGGNKFVDRGRMTSGGNLFTLPANASNRSWVSVEFDDWDGDGDQDLFASFADGPDIGNIVRYENTTVPGGLITFTRVVNNNGYLKTQSGKPIGNAFWAQANFVDWDGDGKRDIISGNLFYITFFKNVGPTNDVKNMQFADGIYIKANGKEIMLLEPRPDCADIDSDGDLDMIVPTAWGSVYMFKNVGTRTSPVFTSGRIVAFAEAGAARTGVKVADWDGDGLLDFVAGRYWENTHWGEQPRMFGRLYKNIGTATNPKFEARDAYNGSPYTEQFQKADSVRQNGVRSVDWDNDGNKDLISSDTDGFVWFFRNLTSSPLFPVFAAGERLLADGKPLKVASGGEYYHGYARADICDWNNDGKKDVLVADTRGWLTIFMGTGTPSNPALGPGTRVIANGKPIDGTSRASVLVCDWDNDGKKDLIFGMGGNGNPSDYYDWPKLQSDQSYDSGFLLYKNIGTDANPVLGYPSWIRASGSVITYTNRPNLGSYIDWDGDNKMDFITGEFENSVRFYKNTGTNQVPNFANINGVTLVQPDTVMLVSGAHAMDWNGDGDLDILTGQGHAGSGLRFYERDYIQDYINNTYPIVTVGSSDYGRKIAEAKRLDNTQTVTIPYAIVTAQFPGYFYIESKDRSSGIRVEKVNHGVSIGQQVDVTGILAVNPNGERYISNPVITHNDFY